MMRRLLVLFGAFGLLVLGGAGTGFGDEDPKEELQRLLRQAQEQAAAKKFAEAAGTMKKVLKLAPKNHLYLAVASDWERQAGNYAEALKYIEQALKLDDKVGAYHVLAAVSAYSNQEPDRARAYVRTVLKRGESAFGAKAVQDARVVEGLVVKKTYTITWNLDPRKGRAVGGAYPVAMPKAELPYQSVKYEVAGAVNHRLVKGEANDVLYVVPQPGRKVQLTTRITVQPYSYKKLLAARKPAPLPLAARAYLGPSAAMNPASPKLAKAVAGLKSRDSAQTVRNIAAWLKKNITYRMDKKTIGELDFKTVDEIVERGHAECRGYSMLFTALCRAAGVPARPIWGLAMLPPEQGGYASHNWTEVYIAGVGWVPIDPQQPETFGWLPTNDLRFFMDAKKVATSLENLPLINLLAMNGAKLKYEESREGTMKE
jgi:tetratricopeptide (TPR) repeat protein